MQPAPLAPRPLALTFVAALAACEPVVVPPPVVGQPGPGGGADAPPPPNPIVLCHGFFGFDELAGLDAVPYFYRVPEALAAAGEPLVFTPAVDPFNDSEVRGEQLIVEVEAILAATGATRVNLVGHSQGGVDARYVASLRPDLVASVTTIATPHRGTALLDAIVDLDVSPGLDDAVDALVRLAGAPLYDAVGEATSLVAAMDQLSQRGMADFNDAHPDAPGVAYFSIGGRSNLAENGGDCDVPDAPAFIREWARDVDPLTPFFWAVAPFVDGDDWRHPIPNDGLVTVPSARWGRFLGCVPADHMDEVGQLLGDVPGVFNRFRHDRMYVELVAFLRAGGY